MGALKKAQLKPEPLGELNEPWADGTVQTPVGAAPRARTVLLTSDKLGTWRARWGVWRMRYMVKPGLYAIGNPTDQSPVLVTSNYKLTFDDMRSKLAGIDTWVLVLDTKGINVWCAAGKGTFGTEELVERIAKAGLEQVVAHRTLVLPQLGAPGVAAHEVRRRTGFRVVYGPVRAADIPEFLSLGMKATEQMRAVRFTFMDRLVLVPMELLPKAHYALAFMAGLFVLSALSGGRLSLESMWTMGPMQAGLFALAYLCGTVLGPLLLPWTPGRALSTKGAVLGALVPLCAYGFAGGANVWTIAPWALIAPAVSSYAVMNFTGSTPYTSFSGVMKEMRYAVPAQLAGLVLGVGLWIGGRFVSSGG